MEFNDEDIKTRLIWKFHNINRMYRCNMGGKESQNKILRILLDHKNVSQNELTLKLRVKPSSMSELLSKLESNGLIWKKVLHRTNIISLTDKGIEEAKKIYKNSNKDIFKNLELEELEELERLLNKIMEGEL